MPSSRGFPNTGVKPRHILYCLNPQGSPWILEWVDCPFSRGSSQPGIELESPALQVDSLPVELLLVVTSCYTLVYIHMLWIIIYELFTMVYLLLAASLYIWTSILCPHLSCPGNYHFALCLFLNAFDYFQFSSVQGLRPIRLFVTSWTAAHQASLSIINSQSLLKLMSTELVMPS